MVLDFVSCFWKWSKMHFKKRFLTLFCRFYDLTSDAIFSVICPCRRVFNTIFENYKEKSFQKWFLILSYVFGSSHNAFFLKIDFLCQFFAQLLNTIFSVICLCYFVRCWGPEGPPMRARRAPHCPPQELEGRARRALNF